MTLGKVLARLESLADPGARAGMARFGIKTDRAYGISVTTLRAIAKETGRDHDLAARLWATGLHEARLLACLVDDPRRVSEEQMEAWAGDFDSWDLCDGCCGGLFDKTPFAFAKAMEWSERGEEFVKRAGFALMAALAVHDKRAGDERFYPFLEAIARQAYDDRNYVQKAVNWALRQIGKRNAALNARAIATAREIQGQGSRAARWIASDALRELASSNVQDRLSRTRRAARPSTLRRSPPLR